jgi:2-polyprenylphenol 6-hydroxylase
VPVDKQHYDVIVVGGGLVGMACALSFSRQGVSVALIESKALVQDRQMQSAEVWDSRIYAITPANLKWLQQLGIPSEIYAERVCAIAKMRVFGDAEASELTFEADAANVEQLGMIIESQQLEMALLAALNDSEVQLLAGIEPTAMTHGDQHACIQSNGQTISAQLLVAADGAQSWLRNQAGISVTQHDYQQMGVVANFATALPHQQTAYQWFGDHGVLAWLPLPGNRISMVWSAKASFARALAAMDADGLSRLVSEQGRNMLGELKMITSARAFPLKQQMAERLVSANIALVGDAAHTIHPLAGQGVNLGFRDVQCLAQVLSQKRAVQSFGDLMLLRRYERARKADMMAMQCVTRGLSELFSVDHPALKQLRNWGLNFTNRQPAAKKYLTLQAIK